MQYQKCEVCGKKDSQTMVCSSTLGAFSQNICEICAIANAEDKYMLEAGIGVERAHTYYVPEQDKYFYFISNKPKEFHTKDGQVHYTRTEIVNYLKNK